MPFKSEAQRRKFYALKGEGKMDQKTIDRWDDETPKGIPKRLKKVASAFFDELEKLSAPVARAPLTPWMRNQMARPAANTARAPKSTMPGVNPALQGVVTQQAAKTQAHAGSPLGGQRRKKVAIPYPKSNRQAQNLSGKMGKFISSRT